LVIMGAGHIYPLNQSLDDTNCQLISTTKILDNTY